MAHHFVRCENTLKMIPGQRNSHPIFQTVFFPMRLQLISRMKLIQIIAHSSKIVFKFTFYRPKLQIRKSNSDCTELVQTFQIIHGSLATSICENIIFQAFEIEPFERFRWFYICIITFNAKRMQNYCKQQFRKITLNFHHFGYVDGVPILSNLSRSNWNIFSIRNINRDVKWGDHHKKDPTTW